MLDITEKQLARFNSRISKTSTCWVWNAPLTSLGYGRITINYRPWLAHRLSYELHVGPIPEGLDIDHICHNRSCVNPNHLRATTRKQNLENQSGPHRGNVSGVRGVYWRSDRKKWRANVVHNGQSITVGHFSNLQEAEESVKKKRLELFTHNTVDQDSRAGRRAGLFMPESRA